ncbi:hypothetical protein AKJ48_02590 [candidate division MSBL1 archaeon SCGC-AAA261O19]|uniref:RNA 3'-terminal phosphate cyclase n=2 Tax=candidate division MSBL1 TaxID=215777 RepID=A0A133UZR4_9EURY|nr:hypothetical protein AKJ42_02755 [candidate division MSBL1 archaeon SCGC-AAA261C02]KXB04435.1 hypothetical protein AKJ48_02590 [candidate division MSBL1 archaeon SCGC-AAA261O19]
MIKIDGSIGEGGGSIVRLSTALATVTQEPVEVYNIRAKRDNPGLRPQHLEGLKALAKLCNGKLEGGEIGSTKITLNPNQVQGKKIGVRIKTAGSIGLVLQSLMIPAPLADSEVKIEFEGGATDTFFAPPIDYLNNVTLPTLRKMGYQGEVEQIRRGHYPKGGGIVRSQIQPLKKLKSLKLTEPGKIKSVQGISHCVKLPGRIAEKQASSAKRILSKAGYDAEIEVETYKKSEDPHLSPGTGIVLWAETENEVILGSSALGKKGKPAEKVGREAAENLVKQLETGCAVDQHLTDQLIPYLALAEGESEITSAELTSHTLTNIELVKQILGTEFEVDGEKGEPGRIQAKGRSDSAKT